MGRSPPLRVPVPRAAVALSVSGVIAGLFGPDLLKSPGNLSLAAIASLTVTAVPAIYYVLAPHKLTQWPQGDGWRKWLEDYLEWAAKYNQPEIPRRCWNCACCPTWRCGTGEQTRAR